MGKKERDSEKVREKSVVTEKEWEEDGQKVREKRDEDGRETNRRGRKEEPVEKWCPEPDAALKIELLSSMNQH